MLAVEKIVGGQYQILSKLQEGGMGAVYKVRHRLLDEVRAIKLLKPQLAFDEDLQKRFHKEAQNATRLRHPQIAQLYDFSVAAEEGIAFIVMEFIEGVSLRDIVQRHGPPAVPFTVEIARQCLNALNYLHKQGFVHRDIAADNFMLTRDYNNRPLVKLIDLGIAKGVEQDRDATAVGVFLGKALYSSPEQIEGGHGKFPVDRRSDLYSFGVMLYRLLTGYHPIPGQTFAKLAAAHLYELPLSFDETDPDHRVPEGLRQVVLTTLEKNPNDRYSSAEELWSALELFHQKDAAPEELIELLEVVLRTEDKTELPEPGSTQGRLDLHFTDEAPFRTPDNEPDRGAALRQVPNEIREDTETDEQARRERGSGEREQLVQEAVRAERVRKTARLETTQQEIASQVGTEGGAIQEAPQREEAPELAQSAVQVVSEQRQKQLFEKAKMDIEQAIDRGKYLRALALIKLARKDHPTAAAQLDPLDRRRAERAKAKRDVFWSRTKSLLSAAALRERLAQKLPRKPSGEASRQPKLPAVKAAVTERLEHLKRWLDAQPAALRRVLYALPIALAIALLTSLILNTRTTEPVLEEPMVAEQPTAEPQAFPTVPAAVALKTGVALDAFPWASIDEIVPIDGVALSFGQPLHTPLFVSLEPGKYKITLNHPSSAEPTTIEIEVAEGEVVEHVAVFSRETSDQHFLAYGLEP